MEGPAAPCVASAVFRTMSPVRLLNNIEVTVGTSPCSSTSGLAGFAWGCFVLSMARTSGVSSSTPPLPCSVMREIAA